MRTMIGMAVVSVAALAQGAAAEPLGGSAAARMLYSPGASEVVMVAGSGLSASDQVVLAQLFKLSESDLKLLDSLPGISAADRQSAKAVFREFKDARYYAAVAAAPRDGLVTPATQIAQNLHSPEAADAAALAACRKSARSACAVVARVLPKRFKPQPLTLSADATEGVRAYRRARAPKALAASRGSDAWVVTQGFGATLTALRQCNERAVARGAKKDCAVLIADD